MAKRGPIDADDEGNTLPDLDPNSDMAKIIYLIEYARRRGFRVGPTLKCGDTVVQVQDLKQDRAGMPQNTDRGIWVEHGHDDSKD